MTDVIQVIAVIIVSYLLGSLNFALILSQLIYKEDIRNYGSKNAGTTNMMRIYGKKAALFTIIGDIAKGIIAIIISRIIWDTSICPYVAGLACIIGHVLPVFYKFKGGKGVATGAAIVLMINPIIFLIMISIFILIVVFTKYVSLASCMTALSFPLLIYIIEINNTQQCVPSLILSITMILLIIYKHRTNIKRLIKGQESKVNFKNK